MLGEGNAAFAVPVFDIIKRGRHAGVAGIGKGGRCGQQAEHAAQHQHSRAVFGAVGQVGFVPRGSAGAQPPQGQQRQIHHRQPQQREIHRAWHIGQNRLHGIVQVIAAVLSAIALRLQGQGIHRAGKIQCAHQAACRSRGRLPLPALARGGAGFIGTGDPQDKQRVLILRIVAVILVDNAIQRNVIQRLMDAGKGKGTVLIVQSNRLPIRRGILQIGAQVNGLVAVGCKIGCVAHEYFQADGGNQQRSNRPKCAVPPPAAQAEQQHSAAGPQRRPIDGQQAEQIKPMRQPRLGKHTCCDDPHCQHNARPGQYIRMGCPAAAQPPRQCPNQHPQQDADTNCCCKHKKPPYQSVWGYYTMNCGFCRYWGCRRPLPAGRTAVHLPAPLCGTARGKARFPF